MYPCGIRCTTTPPASTNSTAPSAVSRGDRPCSFSGNSHDVAADADRSTIDSFNPTDVADTCTSVPANTPAYVTVDPDTLGATGAAPSREQATACAASVRSDARAGSA